MRAKVSRQVHSSLDELQAELDGIDGKVQSLIEQADDSLLGDIQALVDRKAELPTRIAMAEAKERKERALDEALQRSQRQEELSTALVTLQERYVEMVAAYSKLTKGFFTKWNAWEESYLATKRAGHRLGVDVVPPLRGPPCFPEADCLQWVAQYGEHFAAHCGMQAGQWGSIVAEGEANVCPRYRKTSEALGTYTPTCRLLSISGIVPVPKLGFGYIPSDKLCHINQPWNAWVNRLFVVTLVPHLIPIRLKLGLKLMNHIPLSKNNEVANIEALYHLPHS